MYNADEITQIIGYFMHCYAVSRVNDIPKFALAIILRETGSPIGDVGIGRYSGDPDERDFYELSLVAPSPPDMRH